MPTLLSLLLQTDPAAVVTAAQTLKQQSAQTGEMLRDYGALVNLLYLLAIAGACTSIGAVIWIIRKGDTFATTVQATATAVVKPIQEAYALAEANLKAAHAMEIRGNEANHQAQLRAMEKQLEAKDKQLEAANDERREVGEKINSAYREMNEVVRPFTASNNAIAERMNEATRVLTELKAVVVRLQAPHP